MTQHDKNQAKVTATNADTAATAPEAAHYALLRSSQKQALTTLKHIWDAQLTVEEIMLDGFSLPYAKKLFNTANTFWRGRHEQKLHDRTLSVIARKDIPLEALFGIDQQIRHLYKHNDFPATQVLAHIIDDAQGTVPEIIEHAKGIVTAYNQSIKSQQKQEAEARGQQLLPDPPEFFGGHNANARGRSRGFLDADLEQMDALRARLSPLAKLLKSHRASLTDNQAMGLALFWATGTPAPGLPTDLFEEAAAAANRASGAKNSKTKGRKTKPSDQKPSEPSGPAQTPAVVPPPPAAAEEPALSPTLVITLTGFDACLMGQGGKTSFGLSNGTTLTAEEILRRILSNRRRVLFMSRDAAPLALLETQPHKAASDDLADLEDTYREVPGRLNSGRKSRAANPKQRHIAEISTLTCAWPGCNQPATNAQVHHMKAWKHGGNTDAENLTMLCPYHNGRNDDSRERLLNGYVFHQDGEIYYQPPDGSEPIKKSGPLSALTAGALAKSNEPIDITTLEDPDPPDTPPDQKSSEESEQPETPEEPDHPGTSPP